MRLGTNRTDVETKDSDSIPAISQEETQKLKKARKTRIGRSRHVGTTPAKGRRDTFVHRRNQT
jgi:hypothetical protein